MEHGHSNLLLKQIKNMIHEVTLNEEQEEALARHGQTVQERMESGLSGMIDTIRNEKAHAYLEIVEANPEIKQLVEAEIIEVAEVEPE